MKPPMFCIVVLLLQVLALPVEGLNIKFSGRTWTVKDSGMQKWGPGPNFWSSNQANVNVDSNGFLHLKITNTSGRWVCGEVALAGSLGYGTYSWTIGSETAAIDPRAVASLFTYSQNPSFFHRSMAVDLSRWTNAASSTNAQFVVQPWNDLGNLQSFAVSRGVATANYTFRWEPDLVDFEGAWEGGGFSWRFNDSGEVPPPGDETPIINFYLFQGAPPDSGQDLEFVVERFSHVPLPGYNATNTSVFSTEAPREVRTVQFSGWNWTVKDSEPGKFDPGPNYWSSSESLVSVDQQGFLHLKILKRDGKWKCSEMVLTKSLGYGRYLWTLDIEAETLDPQAVVGLFTFSHNNASYAHRELDVELARWGNPSDSTNAQYVVQPWDNSGNLHRFTVPTGVREANYSFLWTPGRVDFESAWKGGGYSWVFNKTGEVPPPGGEVPIINFWLHQGAPPVHGKELEVVVERFLYLPLKEEGDTATTASPTTTVPDSTSTDTKAVAPTTTVPDSTSTPTSGDTKAVAVLSAVVIACLVGALAA